MQIFQMRSVGVWSNRGSEGEACTASQRASQSAQRGDVALTWAGILNSHCDKAFIPLGYTDVLHSWGPF